MDAELASLQEELALAQQGSAVQRLSDSNVVDLVIKLQQQGKLEVRHLAFGLLSICLCGPAGLHTPSNPALDDY